MGQYERRAEEWAFQLDLAHTEISQIEMQIEAAQIREKDGPARDQDP